MQREVSDILLGVRVGKGSEIYRATLFYGIQRFQRVVDVITFNAAYDKALSESKLGKESSEEERKDIFAKAKDRAMRAVKDTQASGLVGDQTKWQRGCTT